MTGPANTVQLSFLTTVALAGLSLIVAQAVLHRSPRLRGWFVPEPLLAGLLGAVLLALPGLLGWELRVPTHGRELDFLVALLTTNMGLHITPRILRRGLPVFGLFLVGGVLLYPVQLALALPAVWTDPAMLQKAILAGPLSLVGAPFNLNPPDQTAPLTQLMPAIPELKEQAQAVMMLGVLTACLVGGVIGRWFFSRTSEQPPSHTPAEEHTDLSLAVFGLEQTRLVVLVLTLAAVAFLLQDLLLRLAPWLTDGGLPVIVLGFLLAAATRLLFTSVRGRRRFPEKALTVLLIGPTMGLVLSYAIMSIPLRRLVLLEVDLALAAFCAMLGSVGLAYLLFRLARRFTDPYYAAVVATAFFAVTTAWGPVAMSYLHRFMGTTGKVEPMPVILPLNAFYLFPWMVILATQILL